jgi:hypothetical protein
VEHRALRSLSWNRTQRASRELPPLLSVRSLPVEFALACRSASASSVLRACENRACAYLACLVSGTSCTQIALLESDPARVERASSAPVGAGSLHCSPLGLRPSSEDFPHRQERRKLSRRALGPIPGERSECATAAASSGDADTRGGSAGTGTTGVHSFRFCRCSPSHSFHSPGRRHARSSQHLPRVRVPSSGLHARVIHADTRGGSAGTGTTGVHSFRFCRCSPSPSDKDSRTPFIVLAGDTPEAASTSRECECRAAACTLG